MSLDSLRLRNSKCANDIVKNPTQFLNLVREWAKGQTISGESKKASNLVKQPAIRVDFEGHLGSNFVSPRGLCSRMANQLVGVQGIITKMSISRHLMSKSVHFCEKTGASTFKEYPDEYSPEEQFDLKKNKIVPKTDVNNNPLSFEYGKSTFKNFQTLVVQELPEMSPPGQLPRSVTVIVEDDLVDRTKPGDRVQVMGIYRLHAGNQAVVNGIMKASLVCTSIMPLNQQSPLKTMKPSTKLPFPENQVLSMFSQSVCPSIYGHEQLKKAVLLMLLGGCEKVLENRTHLRGDINLLMVGDPGTAKSQILRWVHNTVEICVGTTGSGASGVGLTAAVTTDKDTGERNLEPGAMVLADRGFVCIDEFDKMNETDRVAVHEVMEQQTVTIAKAGIHCSLNARCSVIAAANPIYGEYQKDMPPTKNVGMPDSLLSRFDLIFIILDDKDPEKDRRIAERVCKNHRYSPVDPNSLHQMQDDYVIEPHEFITKPELMLEKSNLFKGDNRVEILTQGYLRQYVNYCRKNIAPVLSDTSIEILSNLWAVLRQKDLNESNSLRVLPITIRSYETLIRLSTAHAKLRLSASVEAVDCKEAFRLMTFSLYRDENAMNKELQEVFKSVGVELGDLEVASKPKNIKPKKEADPVVEKDKKEAKMISEIGKMTVGEREEVDRAL